MKKILILILLSITCIFTNAQVTQYLGTPGTTIKVRGKLTVDTSSILKGATKTDTIRSNVTVTYTRKNFWWFGSSITRGDAAYKTTGGSVIDTPRRFTNIVSDAVGMTVNNLGVGGMSIEKRIPATSGGNMIDQLTSFCPTKTSSDSLIFIEGPANDVIFAGSNPGTYNKANFITDLTSCITIVTGKGWPAANIRLIDGNYLSGQSKLFQDSVYDAYVSVSGSTGVSLIDVYHTSQYYVGQLYNTDLVHPGLGGHSLYALTILNALGNPVKIQNQRIASNDTVEFAHIKIPYADTIDIRDGGPILYDRYGMLRKGETGIYIKNAPQVAQDGFINMNGGITGSTVINGGMIQALGDRISDALATVRPELFTHSGTSSLASLSENPVAWKPLDINAGGSYICIGLAHYASSIDNLKVGGHINATGSIRTTGTGWPTSANTGASVSMTTVSSVGFIAALNWNGTTFGAGLPLNINYTGQPTAIGGNFTPTARLHLAAGSATASTAPLKLTSGTNLTTPENGAVEYDGTNFYFTPSGAVRQQAMLQGISVSSATTLTLALTAATYVFTGGTATTWTLPDLATNVGRTYFIKNRGTATITLTRAGSDNLYTSSSVTTLTINPGDGYTVINDGNFWLIL